MAGGPTASEARKRCPYCGEEILATARKCRYCQEYLDEELRAAEAVPRGLDSLLTPEGRPASAIAAGYLGLLSLLPFFGLFAILCGLVALRTLRRNPYLIGRGRAWFGLVMGVITTLIYAIPIVILVIEAIDAAQGRRPRF